MLRKLLSYIILIASVMSVLPGHAQDTLAQQRKKVYIFEMKEEIAPPVWRKFEKAIGQAVEMKADLFLIHMNTYGGMVVTADSISYRLLNCPIPTAVLIDNNAASAGAWISISCDSIYMTRSASIGAATVVDQTAAAMPDKYQSYMRSRMRAAAEAKGRDPQIAEAMVDQDLYVEGVVDTGKVLTFTTSEAQQFGFCDKVLENIDEVIAYYGYVDAEKEELEITSLDRIIGWLIKPFISGILIMIIIGGIYFELQSPGIGFPLGAALLAALLYFAPLYLEGLAAHWEILVFVIGVVLILVEVFAIPGFGVAGVSGIILVVFGLALSMIDNINLEPASFHAESLVRSLFIVIIAIFGSVIGSFWLTKKLFSNHTFLGELSLVASQPSSEGFTSADSRVTAMVGKEGVSHTILRPAGKVNIDGEILDATAETGYIDAGAPIRIVRYEAAQVVVRKL